MRRIEPRRASTTVPLGSSLAPASLRKRRVPGRRTSTLPWPGATMTVSPSTGAGTPRTGGSAGAGATSSPAAGGLVSGAPGHGSPPQHS